MTKRVLILITITVFLFLSYHSSEALALNNTEYSTNLTDSAIGGLPKVNPGNPLEIIALGALVAAAVGGPMTYFSVRYQRKQLQLSAILEAFKILNNDKHRGAREKVYCAYHLYETKGRKDIFKEEPFHSSAAMVRADMDQMGLLIEENLIDKEKFLRAYWNTVLVCWKALERDINRHKDDRKYPSYMEHFATLKAEAEFFRRIHHPDSEILVFSDDDCDIRLGLSKVGN